MNCKGDTGRKNKESRQLVFSSTLPIRPIFPTGYGVTAFFLIIGEHPILNPGTVLFPKINSSSDLEQNTYNNCPVCGYPLTADSAVCPRCGNDILEDISSLDQQSLEAHHNYIEEKKAAWYTRCLAEKLNCSPDLPAGPSIEITLPDHQGHRSNSSNRSNEIDHLLSITRAELLKESGARKKWWSALTDEWQEIVRTTLKVTKEPSDQELLTFLDTTHLRCDNRRIHDLHPVRILEKLQQLRCDESPIESLEAVAHLEKLQRLYAFDCNFCSLEPLRNLKYLKLLWISSTQVTSLEPISQLLSLEELYCSETQIETLAPLERLSNLEKLSCYNTGISSLEPLRALENLIEFGINSSFVADLSPLAGLDNLEYLRCSKTAIASVEPLRMLPSLRELSLSCTPLLTIDALEELPWLEELDIANTMVSSIAPLMHLEHLEKLELTAGSVPREELERFIELHPVCEVILRK